MKLFTVLIIPIKIPVNKLLNLLVVIKILLVKLLNLLMAVKIQFMKLLNAPIAIKILCKLHEFHISTSLTSKSMKMLGAGHMTN